MSKLKIRNRRMFQCRNEVGSNLVKDGKVNLVDDKDFIIRGINGYQWIQFVEPLHWKGGTYYVPSGNPQQMFEKYNLGKVEVTMLPVECEK